MLRKYTLFLLAVLGCGIIVFLTPGILQLESKILPETVFQREDGELYIFDAKNYDKLASNIELNKEKKELLQSLNGRLSGKWFLSSSRDRCLLYSDANDAKNALKEIADETNLHTRTWKLKNGWNCEFEYNRVLFYKGKRIYRNATIKNFPKHDKNALFSIINFKDNSCQDYYQKGERSFAFKSTLEGQSYSPKVNDYLLFGSCLPAMDYGYEFISSSWMDLHPEAVPVDFQRLWMDRGYVVLTFGREKVVISDYKNGQDPLFILDENLTGEEIGERFKKYELRSEPWMGNRASSLYAYQMDNFVVLAANEQLCTQVVGAAKLGNTVQKSDFYKSKIYQDLPQEVHYRLVDERVKQAKYALNGWLHTTQLLTDSPKSESTGGGAIISLDGGEPVQWTQLVSGNVVFAFTKTGKLICFKSGKKAWSKEFGQVENPSIIDVYNNGKDQVLFNVGKQIHIIDNLGNELNGFPIQMDFQPMFGVAHYFWKDQSYFLTQGEAELVIHDAKGREITGMKVKSFQPSIKPVVWASQGNLFAGIVGDGEFLMINLEKRRIHRRFQVGSPLQFKKVNNELFILSKKEGKYWLYNQLGAGQPLPENAGDWIASDAVTQDFLFKSTRKFKFMSESMQWKNNFQVSSNDIRNVYYSTNDLEVFALVDDLENSVYLYKKNGQPYGQGQLKGQQMVSIHQENGTLFVATIVDNLVVVYKL